MPTTPLSNSAHQVIAHALIDSNFRNDLAKNTDAALKANYPGLSAADVASIKHLNPAEWGNLSVNDLSSRLGKVAAVEVSKITTSKGSKGGQHI